jgi:hypothetical protein
VDTDECARPLWTPTSEWRPRVTGVEGTLKTRTTCEALEGLDRARVAQDGEVRRAVGV